MKKSAFLSALSIGVMSISMAFADPAAVTQVRENAAQVLKILNQANGKNNAQIRQQAEAYATPYFDFDRMTVLAVGNPWQQANTAQRKSLVEGFKNMMRSNYAEVMLTYKNAKVEVKDKPVVNGSSVEVKTVLSLPNGKAVNTTFITHKKGSRFLVYDVKVEGGSLVSTYRGQFRDIVRKQGIDGLIKHLNTPGAGKK